MAEKNPASLVVSYLTLRKAVGWIGLALPFVLALGGFGFEAHAHAPRISIESSISSYYYTGMGNVFVGLLCAVGAFHLATEGYDRVDRIAGYLACLFALGVAWFPTTPDSGGFTHAQDVISHAHYTFAALLFLTLAFFCIFQFTQTNNIETRTPQKKERNVVYYICGGAILGCIAVIGTVKLLEVFNAATGFRAWLDGWKWNFWFESLALVAYGVAFLIKGEFILKDEPSVRPAAQRF